MTFRRTRHLAVPHEVLQCRQFDPVSGTSSMNKEGGSDGVYSVDSTTNLVAIKSREAYFKRRRKKSGIILLVLSMIATGLLTGIIALGILYGRHDYGVALCDSEDCVRIAASLKESMDISVDPCEDFYQYTCGRWSENHPTPDTNTMNSWFNERAEKVTWRIRELLRKNLTAVPWAVEQAKIFYESCVNTKALDSLGLEPLFDLLSELDLPTIPAMMGETSGNFVQKIARVRKILGKDVFIGFNIIPNPKNRSKNVIILDTPSVLSPLPGDKEIEKRMKTLRMDMAKLDPVNLNKNVDQNPELIEKAYITAVIKEMISNGTLNSCNSAQKVSSQQEKTIKKVVQQIYDITGLLFQMSHADSNSTLSDENINDDDYMLVDELQKVTDMHVKQEDDTLEPKLIWRPYIEEIFKGIIDLELSENDKLLIANLGYLKDLAVLMASLEEDVLETILWWSVVDVVAPHSSTNLRDTWSNYIDNLVNVEIYDPRSLHCAEVVNYMMGMAVSWLFVDPEFHDETGPKVTEMLEDIRAAFAYLIDMKDDEYLKNMLTIIRLSNEGEIRSTHRINYMNETYWGAEPTDVNAVYTVTANHITVPAGILQFPFYELGLEALNYGAIGTVLGHELTHGFDNSGRLYDGEGNIRQWWSNETIHEYKDKVECFINHYENYYEEQIDAHIDGVLTLDENIADNGGLREAVYAYKRWKDKHGQEPRLPGFTHLTHEQLLFLSFAHLWCEAYTPESLKWMLRDSHSPGHVRLRAVLTNSNEFSDAWKCPVGSPMNPKKKCRIW
ncbi:endothelin-converting enzyme homolog isoform X2 [Chelonus insularis]|uniref:endothelin-converting enzyme homolog isoform X2 n=1 Tax=Chelonus insularis TaxID=460826 RepID=UPI00158920AB|nr:endothelin-converting enzyme homolog isoform X2 [Chelonus insularis]